MKLSLLTTNKTKFYKILSAIYVVWPATNAHKLLFGHGLVCLFLINIVLKFGRSGVSFSNGNTYHCLDPSMNEIDNNFKIDTSHIRPKFHIVPKYGSADGGFILMIRWPWRHFLWDDAASKSDYVSILSVMFCMSGIKRFCQWWYVDPKCHVRFVREMKVVL